VDTADITSIVLAALTAIYVVYTGRLNHHSRDSAKNSERSATSSETAASAALETAQASQRAAEAAERSAALSEAAISVDFSVRVVTPGSHTMLWVRSETASVFISSIQVKLLVVPAGEGGVRELSATTRYVSDDGQEAVFVHRGENALAGLKETVPTGDTVFGHAVVRYGFLVDQSGRERLVSVPRQTVGDAV
jgi:hypothetical protein